LDRRLGAEVNNMLSLDRWGRGLNSSGSVVRVMHMSRNLKGRSYVEVLGAHGRIILKCIFWKDRGNMEIGLGVLRIRPSDWSL
jgi:hypothetical protein